MVDKIPERPRGRTKHEQRFVRCVLDDALDDVGEGGVVDDDIGAWALIQVTLSLLTVRNTMSAGNVIGETRHDELACWTLALFRLW